jgi:hypothetical protein
MTTAQAIVQQLLALSEDAQREVLDFVEFIKVRNAIHSDRQEESDSSSLSLASAMKDMEDEQSPYTLEDIKETFSSAPHRSCFTYSEASTPSAAIRT